MRAAGLAVLFVSACAWMGPNREPSDTDRALGVVGELENAHRYAIARAQLASIAEIVGPIEAEELRLRACRTYGLEGRDDAARACYATLQPVTPGPDPDERAEATELAARAARQLVTTPAASEIFIIKYAGTDESRRALIAQLADTTECPAKLALLDRIESAITASLAADIAVRRAELLFGECRDDERALVAARHAVAVADDTLWRDDAAWLRGRIAARVGQLEEALAAYATIIDTRSDAFPFGSNDSLFLDDAWLAHGLLLEQLGRYGDAMKSLKNLVDARPASRLRDDAERAIARMTR